jgi:hypothetical protein
MNAGNPRILKTRTSSRIKKAPLQKKKISYGKVCRAQSQADKFISSMNKELPISLFKTALQIYHQNVQGLRCKVDGILHFLYPAFPRVLCISEHHLEQLELDAVQLGNYTLRGSYCRRSTKRVVFAFLYIKT